MGDTVLQQKLDFVDGLCRLSKEIVEILFKGNRLLDVDYLSRGFDPEGFNPLVQDNLNGGQFEGLTIEMINSAIATLIALNGFIKNSGLENSNLKHIQNLGRIIV